MAYAKKYYIKDNENLWTQSISVGSNTFIVKMKRKNTQSKTEVNLK
ncbi:hypothetical protein D1AOALGA4SA_12719 [Olavius algarvensis Delta 1 endosymbiont]|nr:hypothetical protein D1AOALGA4SA_12719 [Olavius algarvensis Delta 1 endosymbiont]